MVDVVIYSSEHCHYCASAKRLLDSKGIAYQEIRVDLHPESLDEMVRLSQRRSVPQIFFAGQPVGGFAELSALEKSGELDRYFDAHPNEDKDP